jgi:heme exporter protein C
MATVSKYILGLGMAATLAYIFLVLPPAQGFQSKELARIVALHLPNAMVVMVAAIMAAAFGFRYLTRGRNLMDDAKSKHAAALATLFCLLTTITGAFFAKVQWGAYWNWDPKQTCIFILMLIYAAYFLLRAGIEDPEKRAAVAAVYILFAGVMTPMLGYFVPKQMPSLHPKSAGFDPSYHTAIWTMTALLLGLFAWMQSLAVRYERVRLTLEAREEEFNS